VKEKNGVGVGGARMLERENGSAGNGGKRVKKPPHISPQACS